MSAKLKANPVGIKDFPLYNLSQALFELEAVAKGLRGTAERRAPFAERREFRDRAQAASDRIRRLVTNGIDSIIGPTVALPPGVFTTKLQNNLSLLMPVIRFLADERNDNSSEHPAAVADLDKSLVELWAYQQIIGNLDASAVGNAGKAAEESKPIDVDDKADELPPGTTGHGGDQAEINSPFTPDEKDIWILEVYANRRIYLTQENVETALNNGNGDHRLSVRTIGDRLKTLRKNRLISHPHGKKRKDKITTIGLNFMEKTPTGAATK